MKQYFLFVHILCLTAVVAANTDSLWLRASEIYHENLDVWYAGKTYSETTVMNTRGKVLDHVVRESVSFLNEEGELETVVLYAEKNGKETTVNELKADEDAGFAADEGSDDLSSISQYDSPLNRDRQDRVHYAFLNYELIQGRRYAVFEYVYAFSSDRDFKGRLWVDTFSAVPSKKTIELVPNPRFVDTLEVRMYFSQDPEAWQLKKMEVDVLAGFLIFKRNVVNLIKYSEYNRL